MLRIITHIERLLLVHDCIIIPRFGGFVLQHVAAVYDASRHCFAPMRKEIVFNITLQHNDGLLSESYMQLYQVDFRKAQRMLDDDVKELQSILRRNGTLVFGQIGQFELGEEGQIVFLPVDQPAFSLDTYGLTTFHFPPLVALQTEKEDDISLPERRKKRKDIFYLPINLNLVRTAVATAAAVAVFLLVSTPVTDVNRSAYTASFIPAEMVTASAPIPEKVSSEIPDLPETLLAEAYLPLASSASEAETTVKRSEKNAETRKPGNTFKSLSAAPVEKKAASVKKKMYHIVIASFPSEAQANEYMSNVDRTECKRVSKVVRDGKYRIYADKFDNRKEAEEYMATLRKNEKYKDAWLFISR